MPLYPLLRVVAPLLVAFGAAACGAAPAAERGGDEAADSLRGMVLPNPPHRPDFTLTDTDGAPYSFRERTAGRLTLLFIGYTHCPDVCPVHLANLGAVLGDLPSETRRGIEVVFVSGDPARDTPERMRAWLDGFDRDFVGLTGPLDDVNAILAQLQLPPVMIGEPDENGDYAVGHPAHIIAFPADGGPARAYYGFGTRQVDWRHDLPILLRDSGALPASADGTDALPERATERAVVPAPPADGPAAVYLTVRNRRSEADAIVSASSRVAARASLHGYAAGSGHDAHAATSMMERVDAIEIAARDSVRLRPGGLHVMLGGLLRPLAVGDTFTVELRFRSGRTLEVGALVLPYATVETMLLAEEPRR